MTTTVIRSTPAPTPGRYKVEYLGADGFVAKHCAKPHAYDADLFARLPIPRFLIVGEELYGPGKGEERRALVESGIALWEEHGRPLQQTLPYSVKQIRVTAHLPKVDYLALYAVRALAWERRTLALPQGGGKTYFGDFTGYELQPYIVDVASPFWNDSRDKGFLYVRPMEEMPGGTDERGIITEEALSFCKALCHAHFPSFDCHLTGRNSDFGKSELIRIERARRAENAAGAEAVRVAGHPVGVTPKKMARRR